MNNNWLFKAIPVFIGLTFITIVAYWITMGVVAIKTANNVGEYCEGLNAAECLGKSVSDYKKHADKKD